jgi:GDP-L-fucose synthase
MKESKVIVTGGSGLVGTYLKKYLSNAVFLSSSDFDLTKEMDVRKIFDLYEPEIIVHLAAKVGGILDNIENPADYFTENILMNTLLLKYSKQNNVKRFIGILSTCIYPDFVSSYPIKESELHIGPPTESNFSYGYAKRSLAVQIDAYNKQYGTNYQYLIPCNLYGIGDKDDEKRSHFLTSLLKKIYFAEKNGEKKISLFGDGTPMRQFMFADDLARVINEILKNNIYDSFNVANEENYTIKEMTELAMTTLNIKDITVEWDKTKPNGQHRKDVDVSRLKTLLPNFKTLSLSEGIKKVYSSYYD